MMSGKIICNICDHEVGAISNIAEDQEKDAEQLVISGGYGSCPNSHWDSRIVWTPAPVIPQTEEELIDSMFDEDDDVEDDLI